jgi:hypothetical protein
MATMFGRFEVQSELSNSETALIYKALDTQTNQVVALKTQTLAPLGAHADAFVDTLIREGESSRDLVSQNIVLLYGAGEIEGQFCAAMEYIQGNSVATMLARKEGFSIWDLLDITRQVCAGLEHAAAKNVIHSSLEPAKIMVQWDGMVKILGYGISNMSLIEAEAGHSLGRLMPYCSPEQIQGEAVDLRSNLFTLGAILYEMVAGRKAFDAEDPVELVNQIVNETPDNPSTVNTKIQPGVSTLIMKALAKDPAERYQSARELLDDLEECKENGKKASPESKPAAAAANSAVNPAARTAAANKFVAPVSRAPKATPARISTPAVSAASARVDALLAKTAAPVGEGRASGAAAGSSAFSGHGASIVNSDTRSDSKSGARMISELPGSAPESRAAHGPVSSAAVAEGEPQQHSGRGAVDPMMSKPMTSHSAAAAPSKSFSDLAEMPPLKEPVFAPPIAEPAESSPPVSQIYPRKEEKPKIQPREVAQSAMRQIITLPPRLMLFTILGAIGFILVVVVALFFHVRSEDEGTTAAPRPSPVASSDSGSSRSNTPAPVTTQVEAPAPAQAPPISEPQPNLKVRQIRKPVVTVGRRTPAPAAVPAVILGEALIDSNPQAAPFQVDGKSDPSWITPFSVTALSPGKHIISINKAGYSSEIRSVEITAGAKSSLSLHLSPVNALMVVSSTPPGAEVIIDGKPIGRVTPVQFAVEKGSHTVLLRKQGYLDETVTAELAPAQNFQYSPQLKALGNTEDMRTVGKLGKLFGRGGDSTVGMGAISVHTQPKGAQIAINQRLLDKTSPVDVMLGPGNYVVDITLTGFKPVHKILSLDKGDKKAVDESLERQ